MPSHTIHLPMHRRQALQRLLSTTLGLSLAACGGASDQPDQDTATALLKAQGHAAVASGLVGLVLGQVQGQVQGQTKGKVMGQRPSVAVAGRRRLGQGGLVTPQDRFAIGSNTKAMSCAAIVGLAVHGGPALSLTLTQAFSGWAGDSHPAYARVSLADLLHHRGGLPAFDGSGTDEDAFMAAVAADTHPLPDTMASRRAYFARWLLAQPPAAGVVPGRDFVYSNAGYVLAAAMVEAHTGQSFEAVFDQHLVQPLALQGGWRSPVPGAGDALWGHEGAAGALAVVEATNEALAAKGWLDMIAPAGHWACTGEAYAHWLRWHVLALQGEPTPLPQAYVDDLRAASGGDYRWGWQCLATPNRVLLTHTGHEPGFMAEVVVDRAGDFAVFGLSNTGHFAADGSSWVLARIDQALAEVLKQQAMVL